MKSRSHDTCRAWQPDGRGNCAPRLLLALVIAWIVQPSAHGLRADEPTAAAPAAAAPASDEQIDRWIEQLSDDSYVVRQTAADQLLNAGMAARDALVRVSNGPDPETRAAARRLVVLIDRTEFGRCLSAFAADTDGHLGTTLPGWDEFSDLIGDDAEARGLFVDMQRAEAPLLAQVFSQPPDKRNLSWEDRLVRLLRGRVVVNRRSGPPLGSCATMLFLGALPKPVPSDTAATALARLAEFPPMQAALQNADPLNPVRRLVVAWIIQCANHSDVVLNQRLQLSLAYGLKEALPFALDVASDPQYLAVSPSVRVLAILTVGKLGGSDQVTALEPLLEDATVYTRGRGPRIAGQSPAQVEIRDVALAVLLQLTEQDLQDYGYRAARRHVRNLFSPETLYFASDDERTAALEKWRQWRAGRPAQHD